MTQNNGVDEFLFFQDDRISQIPVAIRTLGLSGTDAFFRKTQDGCRKAGRDLSRRLTSEDDG
jgi:hypothetical protein